MQCRLARATLCQRHDLGGSLVKLGMLLDQALENAELGVWHTGIVVQPTPQGATVIEADHNGIQFLIGFAAYIVGQTALPLLVTFWMAE
jgi:hypothetical protein